VGACLLTFLGTACTPSDPAPPTPSPATSTPTETAQEREQRLAYEAAEKSYREFRGELYRVLRAGGAKSATPKMKATADGPYLKYFTQLVMAYQGQGTHSTGNESTGYVRPEGYSPTEVILDVCEDSRSVRDIDRTGKQSGRGEIRKVRVEVRKEGTTWRVWDGDGKKATRCD